MTENEAKELLLKRLEQFADEEYPLAWIGRLIEDVPDAFVFEANVYNEGEDPQTDSVYWVVRKSDGYCVPNL